MTTKQAGRKRWEGVSAKRRKELMKTASCAYWNSLTPEERSMEMRRRAKVRAARKKTNVAGESEQRRRK